MDLFPISKEEQSKIYEEFGTNEQKIEQDLKILENWTSKQAHFPQKFQYDNFLESVLTKNKFSVERAKIRLEKYFTLKSINKDFYELFSAPNFIMPSQFLGKLFPLPKLGPDQSRIFVGQLEYETDDNKLVMDQAIQSVLQLVEITFKCDRTAKLRFVIDLEHFTLSLFTKVDWVKFARMCRHILDAYSSSAAGIHFLNIGNKPSVFFLGFLKRILKEKLAKRIHIHPDVKSLQQVLPKEYLPVEFGGYEPSFRQLLYKLDEAVMEHKTFLEESKNYASNENLRIGECPFSDLNRVDGTFRSLNID